MPDKGRPPAPDPGALRRALAAADPGLEQPAIRPVNNWGGFVNRSYEVRAVDRPRLFLKLASDPWIQSGLERWHAWGHRLEIRYRAPRTLARIAVPGTPFAGLLLEWIEGGKPEALDDRLVRRVAPLLERLHRDETLRRALAETFGRSKTCLDRYRETLHERFVEDMEGIAANPPHFVDADRLRWMRRAVAALDRDISSSAAFAEPADAPVHGDPWLDNLKVEADGGVRVLDWDDLSPGDPISDWAVLLGPTRGDLRTAAEREGLLPRALTDAEGERLRLWSRATALDWVIDPLADWVEADPATAHGRAVRRVNERVHEEAFARYTARHSS